MKILIVSGTRGIGRQLLDQALKAGHTVTALVRNPPRLGVKHEQLSVITGDILDADSVTRAMGGQDAVCCTIGVKVPFGVTVFSESTKNLLQAMGKGMVKRLICVTGIGAGDSKGHGGFFYDSILYPLAMKAVYADKDRQESLIKASDMDWTIVRPGFLTNGSLIGNDRILTDLTGGTAGKFSRADVAHCMLNELEGSIISTSKCRY